MDLIPFGWDPFFGEGMMPGFRTPFPKVDVQETEESVIVTADIPGLDPKKIDLEIGNENVKISAFTEEERETKKKNFYRKERSSRSFQRIISLPCPVKPDGVKAVTKNGTLTVTLQKLRPKEAKMKKVPIEEQ